MNPVLPVFHYGWSIATSTDRSSVIMSFITTTNQVIFSPPLLVQTCLTLIKSLLQV